MKELTCSLLALVALLGACGTSQSQLADAGTDSDSTDNVLAFKADPVPNGAAVYLSVDLADPIAPVVTVSAAKLGPVFGLAMHVGFNGDLLTAYDPVAAPFLGPDAAKQSRYLAVAGTGEVRLGAVRRGVKAAETDITTPVVVATIPLKVLNKGRTRIELRHLQVRRVDGSFVPVQAAGGDLTIGVMP